MIELSYNEWLYSSSKIVLFFSNVLSSNLIQIYEYTVLDPIASLDTPYLATLKPSSIPWPHWLLWTAIARILKYERIQRARTLVFKKMNIYAFLHVRKKRFNFHFIPLPFNPFFISFIISFLILFLNRIYILYKLIYFKINKLIHLKSRLQNDPNLIIRNSTSMPNPIA